MPSCIELLQVTVMTIAFSCLQGFSPDWGFLAPWNDQTRFLVSERWVCLEGSDTDCIPQVRAWGGKGHCPVHDVQEELYGAMGTEGRYVVLPLLPLPIFVSTDIICKTQVLVTRSLVLWWRLDTSQKVKMVECMVHNFPSWNQSCGNQKYIYIYPHKH